MTLHEINESIRQTLEKAIDLETGEIKDRELLEQYELQSFERKDKIRGLVQFILDLEDDAAKYKRHESRMKELKEKAEKKAANLRQYLANELDGEKIKDPEAGFEISYNPPSVKVDDVALIDRKFFVLPEVKPPEPRLDKKAVKAAIEAGEQVTGVRLVRTMKIK